MNKEKLKNEIDLIVKEAHEKINEKLKEFEGNDYVDITNYYRPSWDTINSSEVYNYPVEYRKYLLLSGLLFKTSEDAIKYAKIDMQVREYVYRENLKNPIDWSNRNQEKFYLFYDYYHRYIDYSSRVESKSLNMLYCTNEKMKDDLINLIGQSDLEWYIKRPAISDLKVDIDKLK